MGKTAKKVTTLMIKKKKKVATVFKVAEEKSTVASQSNLLSLSMSGASHFLSPLSSPAGYWQHPSLFENATASNLCVNMNGSAQVFDPPLEHCFCPPTLTSSVAVARLSDPAFSSSDTYSLDNTTYLAELGVDTLNVSYYRSSSGFTPCGFNKGCTHLDKLRLGTSYTKSLESTDAPSFLANKAVTGNYDGQILANVLLNSSTFSHTAGKTLGEPTALPLFEACIKSMSIGTVFSNDCSEELHVFMDEEPFLVTQSRCSHTMSSCVSSLAGTSMPPCPAQSTLTTTSFIDGGRGGSNDSSLTPVLKKSFDRSHSPPPFDDHIELHPVVRVVFDLDCLLHIFLLVCVFGKWIKFGWVKRITVSSSRMLLWTAAFSVLFMPVAALQQVDTLTPPMSKNPPSTRPADGQAPFSSSSSSASLLPPSSFLSPSPPSLASLSAKNLISEAQTAKAKEGAKYLITKSQEKKSMALTDGELSSSLPAYLPSEARAERLEQELIQMSNELAQKSKEHEHELALKTGEVDQKTKELAQKTKEFAQKTEENEHELAQKTKEFAQKTKEFAQKTEENEHELAQKTKELALKTKENEQERNLRQAAEQLLMQRQKFSRTPSFNEEGADGPSGSGSVPKAERLPIHWMDTKNRDGKAGIDKGDHNIGSDTTVDSYFSIALNEVQARDLFKTAHALVDVAIERRMSTTTVSNQAEFNSALTSNAVIKFTAGIVLTSTVDINGQNGVVIDGKGFELDGNNNAGCLIIQGDAEVSLTNLVITRGNTENGGGVYINSATVILTYCTVTSNTATSYGGGVYICYSATVTMASCTVASNIATSYGGGVYIISGIVTMTYCTVTSNTAPYGGGVYICYSATVTMASCTVTSNFATGVYIEDLANVVTMISCAITSNTAKFGGGFFLDEATVAMTSCTIASNRATYSGQNGGGGGFYLNPGGTVTMNSCFIASNYAPSGSGGGVFVYSSATLHLAGCTFVGNSASYQGGDINQYSADSTLEFYSLCPGSTAYAGTGSLSCAGCTGPADLSNTSLCEACIAPTPFACCGATACSASASTCSSNELDLCPNPTQAPTSIPTQLPTPPPTSSPSPSPTPVPTPAPTSISTPLPTLPPTSSPSPAPSPAPTFFPTPLPTPPPTNSPSPVPTPASTVIPTPLPTPPPTSSPSPAPSLRPSPAPTGYCNPGSFLNGGQCVLCPVGRFSNITNAPFATTCRLCLVGQYAPQQGLSECATCPPGKLSSLNRFLCEDCRAGQYNKDDDRCVLCESGRYAPLPLSDACLVCGAGSHTNNGTGATTCLPCDSGYFSRSGVVDCLTCEAGRFSVSGQSVCALCEAGTFSESPGSSVCSSCAAGKVTHKSGLAACELCSSGKSQPASGQVNCTACAMGQFQQDQGSSACTDCKSGFAAPSSGMGVCNACAAGTFSGSQASECKQCIPGYFSSAAASETCSPCASGKVAPHSGFTACELCPSGSSQPASGQIKCSACAVGSFSDLEGSASCSDCPGNTFSAVMATECMLCLKNFFFTLEGGCAECPTGAACSQDGGATQELLALKPGYWRISPLAAEVYPCELTLACKGGAYFDTNTRSRKLNARGSDAYCQKGYTGPLCSTCVRNGDEAYFLGTGTESEVKECLPCGGAKTFIAVITAPRVIMLLVALVFAVSLIVGSFIKFEPSAKAKKRVRILTDQIARENDTVMENEDGSKTFKKLFEPEGLSIVKQAVSISSSAEAIITKVTTTRITGETTISTETMVRESNALQALFQIVKMSQVQLKALVAFFQIVGKIGFNYSLTWPALFEAIVDELAVFNIDVMSVLGLNCTFKRFDYIDTMLATTLLPLALAALLLVVYLFANLQQRSRRKTRAKEGVNVELTEELRVAFTNTEISNFQEVYLAYATASNGEIGANELTEILKEVDSGLSAADAKQHAGVMIAAADIDNNGSISFSEFVTAMHSARHQGQASAFAELVDKVEAKVAKKAIQATFYAFLLLTFVVLVGTSSKLFNYFKCRAFPEAEGGEESYLFKDYSIDCNSPRYKIFLGYAALMLLIYPAGIPLLYASLLYEHRDVLGNDEAMDREAAHGFPTTGHLLFLIEAYKTEYLYFEVIECGRRLLLAAVIGIVAADSAASPVIGLCISLLFIYVFSAWQPYRNSSTNFLGVVLAFSLTFFFIAALMVKADLSSDDKSDQKTFGFILTAFLFVGPTTLVFQLTKSHAIPLWRRLCARKEVVDEEPTERMAETEQDMIETGVFDKRTVDTPPGSQGGGCDHGANASTQEAALLSSTNGLARAYSGGSGHFELHKLPRSPHAVAGRRYVTADDNDAAISDDDSTENKSAEQEQQQQLHRPSGSGTSSLHCDRLSIDSVVSLDIMPPSTFLSSPLTKKQQSSATRGSDKSAANAAPESAAPGMGKSLAVSRRPRSDGNKTKGTAEKGTRSKM